MHQSPDPMVKDYNWMLDNAAGDAVPDQSNSRVIIVNEPPEGDETSHRDRSLGNPFTSPGDMVAGPYGHGGALPPNSPQGSGDSGDKGEDFCTVVQTLEGIIPLSSVTADNNFHSEVLSNDNFAIPEGGYPAPYVPENFQRFVSTYTRSSRHPYLWVSSYQFEITHYIFGAIGLVETGVGYKETVHIVRRGKEKHLTAIRKYNDLFKQSGYQAAAVDTWGGLHLLPLIMSSFLITRRAPL